MNEAEANSAIRPEILANKLGAIRHLKHPEMQKQIEERPRIVEALWFLQWVSLQPGGLNKFAGELYAASEALIGTASMLRFGRRKYTIEQCAAVWAEIPDDQAFDFEQKFQDEHVGAPEGPYCKGEAQLNAGMLYKGRDELLEEKARIKRWEPDFKKTLWQENEPFLRALVCNYAQRNLSSALLKLVSPAAQAHSFQNPWYIADILGAVLAYMDHRAAKVETRIARTVIVEKVFDALEYSHSERVMVHVTGDSRFGKTESVETHAAMWPGKWRVVRTSPSNSLKDLVKDIAAALGIHHSYAVRGQSLKDKVEHVLANNPPGFIFDEAAWLLPQSYSKTTAPARLNWIRANIIDRKTPCVLIATPQSYTAELNKFTRKTGYSIEQFIGREAMRFQLPSDLAIEDLRAVAQIHFPEADDDLLDLLAAKALQSESYLKAVENFARRARYLSQKRGAKTFSLADVERAIADVMPSVTTPKAATPAVTAVADRQRTRRFKGPLKAAERAFQRGDVNRISSLPGSTDRTGTSRTRGVEEPTAVAG